jgi:hypothetical protein
VATPAERSFRLTGLTAPAGAPVSVTVTSAGGRRPVVVLCGVPPELAGRLARAGFAVVSFDPWPDGLDVVLDALGRGVLDLEADDYALVEPRPDGSIAVTRGSGAARLPGSIVPDADALVQWLAKHQV